MTDPRLTGALDLNGPPFNDPRLIEITDLMRLMAEAFRLGEQGKDTDRHDREIGARWGAFEADAKTAGEIGALDLKVMREPSLADVGSLFEGTDFDLKGALARLEELGLSDLIEPGADQAPHPVDLALDRAIDLLRIEQRVTAALGVKACSARGWDAGENEAFFLGSFAWLYAGTRCNPSVDPESPFFGTALELGRLFEWWRLRRLGLDRRAAERKKAFRAFKGIGEHSLRLVNRERRAAAAERNAAIRAIAAESTFKGTERDRHVQGAMEAAGLEAPSARTIRRALLGRD